MMCEDRGGSEVADVTISDSDHNVNSPQNVSLPDFSSLIDGRLLDATAYLGEAWYQHRIKHDTLSAYNNLMQIVTLYNVDKKLAEVRQQMEQRHAESGGNS